MRLEYTEEQERELRITEIEAILENHLRDSKIEELALEVELQFLQGNENSYGEPIAYVEIDTSETLEIIFDSNLEQYSMLVHDVEGNPMLPYYYADTVEKLLEKMYKTNIRDMTKTERKEIEREVIEIMRSATSSEYASYILKQYDDATEQTFMDAVVSNVMETSAWKDEGYYNDDDIRLAIGREFMARLGIAI